jgi:lipopolysaccharide/colanic/teichoic acid biosynthesis glycosyltransferase
MLLDGENLLHTKARERVLQDILASLTTSVRETDTVGWFNKDSVIGVIFTEIGSPYKPAVSEAVLRRVITALRVKLSSEEIDSIDITLHVFPDQWNEKGPGPPARLDLYPDVRDQKAPRRIALGLKRMIDVAGSLFGLMLLSPFFALAAVLIKLTSKGPVFYRQVRVGRFGKPFVFLKFRTMQVTNDASIHKDYVRRFISGKAHSKKSHDGQASFYKLVNDPRVTRVGRFLRRISFDELPQLLNVLRGEMSLVGPRPPIPYECEVYQLWHRRRLLEAKPGMTGLWQVNGRSRTSFDDMVRLDLRYTRSWSLWLDIKILLKTPQAVLSGEGAY